MRTQLKKLNNQRLVFTADFGEYGTKSNWHGYPETTILLKNVRFQDGKLATDHIWFTERKRLGSLELEVGDRITFEARITRYVKGYWKDGRVSDYKLSNPTKLKKIMIVKQLDIFETN